MSSNFKPGEFIEHNSQTNQAYNYFMPNPLPNNYRWSDSKIPILLEEATHHLGELNAYARLVPDIDFFIKMHEVKEATQSSFIEGTKTEIDEAVMQIEDINPERRDDWKEVHNYIKAMKFAIERLDNLPLSIRTLKETHGVLLKGVRGKSKGPGEIRKSQNWIGGATLKDARFIPPIASAVPQLLSDLEKYWYGQAQTPHLMKAGLSHYQFETIHPFLDGNGRIGRLLIVLYLIDKKLLDRPILYLSDFFANNRSAYYTALDSVRFGGNIDQWLKFFLVATSETAKKSCDTLQHIINLRHSDAQKILQLGKRSKSAATLLTAMYSQPIVNVKEASKILGLTPQATNSLIREMVKIRILKEITGFSRNRMFVYEKYIQLFR
jgi:Fic family protein